MSVQEAVAGYLKRCGGNLQGCDAVEYKPDVTILIGPEGDFSPEEVKLAIENGFIPVHLGASRLRTETAAVVACSWVYSYLGILRQ